MATSKTCLRSNEMKNTEGILSFQYTFDEKNRIMPAGLLTDSYEISRPLNG